MRQIFGSLGGFDVRYVDAEVSADGIFDQRCIDGAAGGVEYSGKHFLRCLFCQRFVHQIGVCDDPIEGSFQFSDVRCDFIRNQIEYFQKILINLYVFHFRFIFQNRHSGFEIRRLDIYGETPFKSGFQAASIVSISFGGRSLQKMICLFVP